MLEFINTHEAVFFWLTLIGIIGLIGSMLVIPWILIQIPPDYFLGEKRKKCPWGNCPPFIRSIILIIKNILGIALVLSGIIMLFIPGQGLLTILVGMILMDFPYKYKILRWLIQHPKILSPINKLRTKAKKSPLKI